MKKQQIFKGLCLSMLMFSLVACKADDNKNTDQTAASAVSSTFKAGTYEGVGQGKNGNVTVEVTLSDKAIESVKVTDQNESADIAKLAIEKIPQEIVDAQSPNVETVSGATMVSDAIIEGTRDALTKAGVDVTKLTKQETKKEAEVEQVEADIVVVGAGAAGTAAALAAQQNGANVVLLEKTATPMGAGTLAGGMFAADSKQQKAEKKEVSKKWLYDQYMDASQGHMNSVLVREIIDEAGPTVDWLNENGATMTLVDAGTGGSFAHSGDPATLHGYQEGGTKAISNLVESFEKAGGKAYFSTPATELITDEKTNEISGVKAEEEDGTVLEITAQKVILATGGFGGNSEMLAEYLGTPNTPGEVAQNTGDGINMAWNVGAGEMGVNTTHYFWQTFKPDEIKSMADIVGGDWFALNGFTSFPNLRVNTYGQRFSDETDATLYAIHGAEIASQPKQEEYVIIDSAMLDTIKEKGTVAIEDQYGQFKDDPQFYMEFNEPNATEDIIKRENTPMDYAPLLDQLTDTGVVFKGDSIEELGKALGVDATNFKASVDQYNGAIESGQDDLYFSDTDRLIKVSQGPFYAVKFVARNLGTLGGVRINDKIEACDADGNMIPNLYVAGADAGGMYGGSYVDFEGGTLGFAYTSGRIAGLNAASSIKK